MDKKPTADYGKRLLSLCKSLDVHIVNREWVMIKMSEISLVMVKV